MLENFLALLHLVCSPRPPENLINYNISLPNKDQVKFLCVCVYFYVYKQWSLLIGCSHFIQYWLWNMVLYIFFYVYLIVYLTYHTTQTFSHHFYQLKKKTCPEVWKIKLLVVVCAFDVANRGKIILKCAAAEREFLHRSNHRLEGNYEKFWFMVRWKKRLYIF